MSGIASPGKSKLLSLAVAFVVLCLAAPAHAALALWATGVGTAPNAQMSALYTIDPFTGAATVMWQFPNVGIYSGGLAYDQASDTLYATGFLDSSPAISRLFTIDRFTGATTAFPGMDPTLSLVFGGMAINPADGVMYATGENGTQGTELYTINKTTGAATLVGHDGTPSDVFDGLLYGLGFRGDGTLYANGVADNPSYLFTVNLGTGRSTEVGYHGVASSRALKYSGLAFDSNGTLYSLGADLSSVSGLYSVNPSTGAASLIGNTGLPIGVDGGLAFAPIPEPGTIGLCAIGLGALVSRTRKRRGVTLAGNKQS